MTMHAYYIATASDADSMALYNSIRGTVYKLGGTVHVSPPTELNDLGALGDSDADLHTPCIYMALPSANTPADVSSDATYPTSAPAFTSGTGVYQYTGTTIGEVEGALASDAASETDFPEDPEIEEDSDITGRPD